jgi:hypothetical protein
VACLEGFEPPTYGLEVRCSIQLSYRHMWLIMERVKGIEPSQSAWKADVLPLNYTRVFRTFTLYKQAILFVNTLFSKFKACNSVFNRKSKVHPSKAAVDFTFAKILIKILWTLLMQTQIQKITSKESMHF